MNAGVEKAPVQHGLSPRRDPRRSLDSLWHERDCRLAGGDGTQQAAGDACGYRHRGLRLQIRQHTQNGDNALRNTVRIRSALGSGVLRRFPKNVRQHQPRLFVEARWHITEGRRADQDNEK
eukprot:scaffold23434_cov135-Isochrysis_galbana.AAC.13